MLNNVMSIERPHKVGPYLGKWIQVTGDLEEVHDYKDGRMRLLFKMILRRPVYMTIMDFDTDKWGDHIKLLRRGAQITVLGRIKRVTPTEFELSDCELTSSS